MASVAPTTIPAGGESLQLTVTGSGFTAGATVYWNGNPKLTTRVSDTRLSAVIPAADLAAVGTGRVAVTNSGVEGLSAEQVVRILHLAPSVSAVSPASAAAGGAGLTISLTGQHFIRTAEVYRNNALRHSVGPAELHHRLECPVGQTMSGVYGHSGWWLDNIGILCGGVRRGLAYTAVYGGLLMPEPFESNCGTGSVPYFSGLRRAGVNGNFLERPVLTCADTRASDGYDPLNATAVPGRVFDLLGGINAMCAPALAIGIDVFVDRVPVTGQKGIAALGMVCARLE